MSEAARSGSDPGAASTSSHPGPPEGDAVYSADADAIINLIENAAHPEEEPDRFHDHMHPPLDLPGFGDPLDDCNEFKPESMRFCDSCGDPQEFPRNCYRYDCPDHAAYAIRRRAAGSKSGAGVCPQLDALRRYLNAYRDDNQYFQHITVEPPADFYYESDTPLEDGRELCRGIMDELGIQPAGHQVEYPRLADEKWLKDKSHGEGLSLADISDILDCSPTTVGTWLDKHGIDKREPGF
jgi:hypothetical protein